MLTKTKNMSKSFVSISKNHLSRLYMTIETSFYQYQNERIRIRRIFIFLCQLYKLSSMLDSDYVYGMY
jgi:hypothetical protein